MFLDITFPSNISYGSIGSVDFLTIVDTTTSGFEVRKNIGGLGRCRFDVAKGVKTKQEVADLISLFRIANGMEHSFRFKDWNDFYATNQKLEPVEQDGKAFQLLKTYQFEGYQVSRKITKPLREGFLITSLSDNNIPSYIIDYNLGIIKFESQPNDANSLRTTFTFDIEARFNTSSLGISINNFAAISQNQIEVIEIV